MLFDVTETSTSKTTSCKQNSIIIRMVCSVRVCDLYRSRGMPPKQIVGSKTKNIPHCGPGIVPKSMTT